MDGQDALYGLDFDQDKIIDKHVDTEADFDLGVAIMNRQRHLQSDIKGSSSQLVSEALLVNGLKQAGPKRLVHRKRRVDDLTRDFVMLGRQLNHLCALASWRFKANRSLSA